jgi:hypothetical protein
MGDVKGGVYVPASRFSSMTSWYQQPAMSRLARFTRVNVN